MKKTSELIRIAQRLAQDTPQFHSIKGPGVGDHATAKFMETLRRLASEALGEDCSEKCICGDTKFAVDFWFPDEMTVVEFALTLRNSSSEFHKDIFKVLLAVDSGKTIQKLVFVSKPGAIKRNNEPGPRAIMDWLKRKQGIEVQIIELQ